MSRYASSDPVGIREHRVREAIGTINSGLRQINRGTRLNDARDRDLDIFLQYERTLFAGQNVGAGDTVENSVLLTAFETKYAAPDSLFSPLELKLRRGFLIEARGTYNCAAGADLTLLVTYNGGTILTTGVNDLPTFVETNLSWCLTATVIQSDDEGFVNAQGMVFIEGQSTVAASLLGMPNTSEVAATITDGGDLEVQAKWELAAAASSIKLQTLVVTGLGSALKEVS